jgi:hemolysin III
LTEPLQVALVSRMDNPIPLQRPYQRDELIADAVIHGIGIVAAVVGVIFLIGFAAPASETLPAAVYGLALIAMLGFSAAYNLTPVSNLKWLLRRFDHSAIYVMIAGTYTPLLVRLEDTAVAMILAAFVWLGALVGCVIKVAFPGRYDKAAIVTYLALGWVGILAIGSFAAVLPVATLVLICIGGLVYSSGVPFYLWDNLKYQNAIWHGFVATAAACHFWAIALLYQHH